MKKQFKLIEFPNVNDPRIYTFSYHLQNIQNTAQTLILNIIDKNKEVKVTIGIVVAILKRIQECVTSIQLLAIKGRSRDIAILLLNVMELRVDLQYIALNVDREDEWIKHENEWRKPWELRKQLKEIYEDKEELEAERDMYHLFSMIKHGSPASKHVLFTKIEENQVYYGENINKDKVKFTLKKLKPHIIEGIQEDGSLIIDTKKIPDYLLKKLSKQGLDNEEIKEKIKLVDELENDKILELSQTEKLVKRTIDSIKPSLGVLLMDERIIALMAYEYLGLLIGNNIVKGNFDFIRDFLINEIVSDNIFIERLTTRKYLPYHKLFPEFLGSKIIINLTLFGWLFFKVHLTIKSNIKEFPDFVYLEDLKNKISYIAKSVSDAKQNKYYALTQRIIK